MKTATASIIDSFAPQDGYQIVPPQLARYWLDSFNYEHQRKIRPYHVNALADEMKQGRFRKKTQINFCELDGRYFLTNGQHTLSAIVSSCVPCELSVVVLHCKSMSEVADDFTRHDTHLTRQLHDSMVAHEIDKELGVTKTELKWIAAACIFYMYMIGELKTKSKVQISNDIKLQAILQYGEKARDAFRCYINPEVSAKTYLTRKTTLACALHVYLYDASLCEDFYGKMAEDDGLKLGDPRKTLLEFLRESRLQGSGAVNAGRKVYLDHHLIKAQSVAFNYYVSRKPLKLIRVDRDAKTAIFKGPGEVNT